MSPPVNKTCMKNDRELDVSTETIRWQFNISKVVMPDLIRHPVFLMDVASQLRRAGFRRNDGLDRFRALFKKKQHRRWNVTALQLKAESI